MTDVARQPDDALVEAVVDRVLARDADGVLDLLGGLPERTRSSLDEPLRSAVRTATRDLRDDDDVAWAAHVVALCVARAGGESNPWHSHTALRCRSDPAALRAHDLMARAVATRPAAWRTRYLQNLLSLGPDAEAWSLASRLTGAGLPDPVPAGEHLPGMWLAHPPLVLLAEISRRPSVRAEAWASLRVDATSSQVFRVAGWAQTLPEYFAGFLEVLGADRPEGRARLLDECLVRLQAVRTVPQARLFVEILAHLEVTDVEIAERQAGYLALLAARCPSGVKVGQAALRRVLDAGLLDGAGVVEASPEVLVRREKGLVKAQLRLLDAAARRGAAEPLAVAQVLAEGFDAGQADVAVATAVVLRRCAAQLTGDEQELVRGFLAVRLPAPWSDLVAALGPELAPPRADPEPTDGAVPHAAETAREPLPVDLPPVGRVELTADADETCELVAALLQDLADPVAVEVALAGVVRWRDVRPVAAKSVAAHAEARRFDLAAHDHGFGTGFLSVVLQWLDPSAFGPFGVVPPPGGLRRYGFVTHEHEVPAGATSRPELRTPPGQSARITGWGWERVDAVPLPGVLQQVRMLELQRLVQTGPTTLLATPSRTDGTLDAETLESRLAALEGDEDAPVGGRRSSRSARRTGGVSAVHDVALALLRLHPADRRAAEARLGRRAPEGLDALDAVSAPSSWSRVVEQAGASTWAAGRDRRPVALWRGPAVTGRLDAPVLGWCDTSTVAPFWAEGVDRCDEDRSTRAALGAWSLSLPHEPDLLAAHLQPMLSFWLEKPTAPLGDAVRALGATTAQLGGPAAAALVWLAAYRDMTVRTATAEALAAAARRGTLTGAVLGRQLLEVLGPDAGPFHDHAPKPTRVAATLADAVRLGGAAERLVLDALVVLLPVVDRLRGGAELVELAAACAERTGATVELPPSLASVAARSATTRVVAAARRLRDVAGAR